MARKTYHHLTEGQKVTLQHYQWTEDGDEVILEEVEGRVAEVLRSRVALVFDMRVWKDDVPWNGQEVRNTVQHFSRQGGQRWGAEEDDYRIHPKHAQKKAKR